MRRVLIVVAATVTGALAAGWVGAQGTRGPPLTGQDYAEIEQLIARYYQALDFEDRAMFESIWTEDAVYRIESMGQPVEGRDAIVQRTVGRWADRPPEHERRHWQNNLVVTPTPEGATARAYWISFEVSYSPPKPALSGTTTTCWSARGRLALPGAGAHDRPVAARRHLRPRVVGAGTMSSPARCPLSRRRGAIVALVAAVLVAASPGAPIAQQGSAPAGDDRRVFVPMPVALRALADNVYQATGNGNSHLVHTPEGNVVFDTGNAPAGQADDHYRLLREAVPGPIRYVIYSHSHADHIGGHPYWIEEGPAIIAHREFEEEQRYLRELAPLQRRRLRQLRPTWPRAPAARRSGRARRRSCRTSASAIGTRCSSWAGCGSRC